MLHQFWECNSAARAVGWDIHLLHFITLKVGQRTNRGQGGSGNTFNVAHGEDRQQLQDMQGGNNQEIRLTQFTPSWIHCVFAFRTPKRFKKASRLWLLIRGIIMWVIWIERNDDAFNGVFWPKEQVFHLIWLQLVDWQEHLVQNTRKYKA
uniref:Uncharacterized protein n=1 Tax=Physcomitrium patens TaxID=3218 RepID=A0A2K1K3Q6_PHYPA|nr:hypothetical protein PHYPA_012887 [Physcomitrium patens]